MRKWLVALFFVLILGGFGGWQLLNALPSRQLARFPKFVQAWVIPEPESATLPTVGIVADAVVSAEITPILSTPIVPTPTLLPTITPLPTVVVVIEATTPVTPTITITPTVSASTLPASTRIDGIVHHQQDWNNCGPATLAMALSIFDIEKTQYDTAAIVKPNAEDRNVSPEQMAGYIQTETGLNAKMRVNGTLTLLKTLLANNFPVIIEIGMDPPGEVAWLEWYGHYLLAVGYDDSENGLWVYDSLIWDAVSLQDFNTTEGRRYTYDDLATYWRQFNRTYIVVYEPEREAELAALVGDGWQDSTMWQESLLVAQAETETMPEDAFAWFNMGTSLVKIGRTEEAAAIYDKARIIGLPWRMLWYQFGLYEAYYATGRYNDIILLADTTLANRPYFEESFYWRGRAYQALGNIEQARSDFQAAAQFNPYFAPASDALAQLNQ